MTRNPGRPLDTSPEIWAIQLAAWRQQGGEGRSRIATELSDSVHQAVRPGVPTVMSQAEFIAAIVAQLDAAGMAYMIAGSIGSVHYGEPRSTQDVDIIIDPTAATLENFLDHLSTGYFCSRSAALSALADRGMFKVVHPESGWKADLIIRKARLFSITEFARRQRRDLTGMELVLAAPEDIILAKLEWAMLSGSDRQLRDAAACWP